MFGNKKSKIAEEQNKTFLEEISGRKEYLNTDIEQLAEAGKRLEADISQVLENSTGLVDNALLNIEEEAKTIHTIDELSQEIKGAAAEFEKLCKLVEKQYDGTIALVEENKHYTTPAKHLTETPGNMRTVSNSYIRQLSEMEEDGRKMSVLALNAAIEAGRIGESGKSFVMASEEIRQTALSYEKKAADMREELERSQVRITELEEVVNRLVALMKENNMAATRLLKKGQETYKAVQTSTMRDFSEDMILIKDKVVGMRNLDEEIAKCGERNKIQLNDIQEDVLLQKNQLAELESDISYTFDILGDAYGYK